MRKSTSLLMSSLVAGLMVNVAVARPACESGPGAAYWGWIEDILRWLIEHLGA